MAGRICGCKVIDAESDRIDNAVMLELRPNCEHCGGALPPAALDARICTFECTFCAVCTDDVLGGVCPNCTGELLARPVRPESLLAAAPASDERVVKLVDVPAHQAMLATRSPADDHAGVALRRYADAWRSGDLTAVLDSYADDFTLHYAGTSRFAGTHDGRDAALQVLAEVSIIAPRELVSVDAVIAADHCGVLVATERLTRNGETADMARVLRYRVDAGRLAECWLHETEQATVDHFWR